MWEAVHIWEEGADDKNFKNISDKFPKVLIPISAYLFTCKSQNGDNNNSI